MSALPSVKHWQEAFDAQPRSEEQLAAFKSFLDKGLPTTKQDAWKYTDLRRLLSKKFALPKAASFSSLPELLPFKNRIVFVDGVLTPSPLRGEGWGEGGADSTAIAKPPLSLSLSLKGREDAFIEQGAFFQLNASLSGQNQLIEIQQDNSPKDPIYLVHVLTAAAKNLMSHPRVTLKLARNSKLTLIEHHLGANTDANFTNSVLSIDIGEHASLEHIRIQDDATSNFNIANIKVNVQRSGHYTQHHFVVGASLARTDLHIVLAGIDASADLHGLILAQSTQHLDVFTSIEHQVANTRSSEDYRGIADQRGRVVFRGKVIVEKDAQQTDAKQSSRNLLLSEHAEIDTRPELEIYANDVKCAHGATVGQLDATSLFYLRSRGIEANEARALLTHAFAAEVIERIPVAIVREHVLARLMSRMRTLEIPK
jgi:Fe-S cluster assembly protein SufD